MNLDKILERLFGKKMLTAICIALLIFVCLTASACSEEDVVCFLACGLPSCETMMECNGCIADCQNDCNSSINQAIYDCSCEVIGNCYACYEDSVDSCSESGCSGCFFDACIGWWIFDCVEVDDYGRVDYFASCRSCGGCYDCDPSDDEYSREDDSDGGYATDEEFREWLEKQ